MQNTSDLKDHQFRSVKKLFRISTVPLSLNLLLSGQLRYLNEFYEVTAISGAGKDLDVVQQREAVKTHVIEIAREISPLKDLISLLQLYRYFKKEKPHIIHSITPKAGLLSMIAGKFAGVPVRMHTFTGLVFPSKTGLFKIILIWMDRLLATCATHIYPEGKGVKSDLEKYRITRKPLKILANGNVNGIDTTYFNRTQISTNTQEKLKQDLGISAQDFVFIFVGRVVRDKGINELVAAFKKLSLHPDRHLKLLLVGDFEKNLNPLLPETLKEIEQNPKILTTGFQEDVRPFFAVSNVLVFPSYREGFPNVVLQAGAMEIPGIVTNINGSNEIIEDQKNGLIIPVKEENALFQSMKNISEDQSLFQTLKENSRHRIVEKYEQKKVWEAILKEYRT